MPGDLVARLVLTADGSGFRGEVRASEQSVRRLSRAVGRGADSSRRYASATHKAEAAVRQASGAFARFHNRALQYGAAAFGAAAIMRGLRGAVSGVIDASVRQEQALAQVESRIRSTGGAAGYTTEELARMAAGFQQATSFGDEGVLEMQSILLSFRSIARESFRGATQAALNLSAALGQDLRSVAIQLGKALDDPKRGLDALSRSGTTFTEAQKEQIRELSAAGRAAEAQAIILAELEVQYGGAAAAARDTLGGALAALGNTWGDLLEVESEASRGLRGWVESLNQALRGIDAPALHESLVAAGRAALVLAAALSGRARWRAT